MATTRETPERPPRQSAAETSCCVCGASPLHAVRRYRTKSSQGARLFGGSVIARCERCTTVQISPRPKPLELSRYYSADYRTGGLYGADVSNPATFPRDNLFYFNRGRSVAERIAEHISRDDARILDVGTGYGHVLHALGERFPASNRLAIEYSDAAVDHLRSIGIEVEVAPVEAVLEHLDREFDIIALSHVLEHLLEPVRVLELLRARLAPDGVLYIEVPNIPPEMLDRYPDHPWAPRYDEPHITFFSTDALTRILERAGFDVVSCETAGPLYREVSRLRYSLPPLRGTIQRWLPRRVFAFLRGLRATSAVRVKDREEEFYEYGGFRIWIRAVARPGSP